MKATQTRITIPRERSRGKSPGTPRRRARGLLVSAEQRRAADLAAVQARVAAERAEWSRRGGTLAWQHEKDRRRLARLAASPYSTIGQRRVFSVQDTDLDDQENR